LTNVEDLYFLDPKRGWLITWHGGSGNGGSHLFGTVDGGRTWAQASDRSFQGDLKWARVIRFVSERVGFVFEREQLAGGSNQADTCDRYRSALIFTTDGGAKLAPAGHPVLRGRLPGLPM
jgi:photosystem II stability/assembly factor-like uncharacterized protein